MTAPAISAQMVRGHVIDSISGAPVEGGFVVLIDSQGNEITRTLTDRTGYFLLEAPEPNEYRLRSLRIGYRAWDSPTLEVSQAGIADYELRIRALPVELSTVEVTGEKRCQVDPGRSTETAVVWEEARKALSAATWTARREVFSYETTLYERDWDTRGTRVGMERRQSRSGDFTLPFRSPTAEQLADKGYVQQEPGGTYTYYAPDADVLLSDTFLETHCFSVVRDPKRAAQLGLTFEPVENREVREVAGALWLDEESAELQSVEYHYTGLPRSIRDQRIGGELEFMPVPSGAWIVRQWNIRMPIVGTELSRSWDSLLVGFRDNGGEVTRLTSLDGRPVFEATFARLAGTIVDSTQGRPLSGAWVALEGTGDSSLTRWDGSFHVAGPFDGDYTVRFAHPRLDSLGYQPPGVRVELNRGTVTHVRLAVPTLRRIRSDLCSGDEATDTLGMILGIVKDHATGIPVPNARVFVTWQDFLGSAALIRRADMEATVTTGSDGSYVVCNLPLNQALTLHSTTDDELSDFLRLRFAVTDDEQWVTLDNERISGVAAGIWNQDLTLHARGTRRVTLGGVVHDSASAQPIAGATVGVVRLPIRADSVRGEQLVTTDERGHFTVDSLEPGGYRVEVDHAGYRLLRYDVRLSEGQSLELPADALSMSLLMRAELAMVEVTGERIERSMRGFHQRRLEGFGSFLTREDFESWNPMETTDVLRRAPGLYVRPNPRYGYRNDSQRYLIENMRMDGLRDCPLVIFLNGVNVGTVEEVDVDFLVSAGNLEAVEIYTTTAGLPPQFNVPGSTCGVIVFWTRQ